MKIHPVADAFPMPRDGVEKMAESIKRDGQLHPIVMLGDELLDGRCRLQACKAAKVEPKFIQYRGKKDLQSLINYVDAANDKRRHMSLGERAVTAVKLAKLAKGEFTANLQLEAKTLGISSRSAFNAHKATGEKAAPELVEAVESGEVSVSDAAAVADLPKSKQKAALKKVESGKARTLRQAATDFDTTKIDAQPNGKPPKSGKPIVSVKDRKEALALHAKLCRALNKLDIYDEFIRPLSQIAERLKQI